MIQEIEAAERLRVTKTSLEVTIDKLEAELEETKIRLRAALSRPITEGADSKAWKASVVTRSANCFYPIHLSLILVGTNIKAVKALINWVYHYQIASVVSRKKHYLG